MGFEIKAQPVTARFANYSAEDARADELWESFQRREDWATHGGVRLYEMPPHIQKLVYAFANLQHDAARAAAMLRGAK